MNKFIKFLLPVLMAQLSFGAAPQKTTFRSLKKQMKAEALAARIMSNAAPRDVVVEEDPNLHNEIMSFIAANCLLNKKDCERLLPDTVIAMKLIREDGITYIPVEKIAAIAEINEAEFEYNPAKETIAFRREKSSHEMAVKPISKLRGDTVYVPVRKIARALDASIRVVNNDSLKVSRPFQSHQLMVFTKNPHLPSYGATMEARSTKYFTAFYYDTYEQAQSALVKLQSRDDVTDAMFNYVFKVEEPDIPTRASKDEYDPHANDHARKAINYDKYIESTPGECSDIIVAVLDSGFDSTDPIFDGRIVPGYDVAENREDVRHPTNYHGTRVAGTVAEFSRPHVKIMPIKVVPDSSEGFAALGIGVYYAIEQKVDVINCSAGGFDIGGRWYRDDIMRATENNIITCVSAGNSNVDALMISPAGVHQAITTGATNSAHFEDRNPIRWPTCYGEIVDTYAPGTDLFCPPNDDYYGNWSRWSGTSFSSPIVAAGIADVMGYQKTRGAYLNAENANLFIKAANNINGTFNLYELNRVRLTDTFDYSSGTGTANNPFTITTEAQLQSLAHAVYKGFDFNGYNFRLENDISYLKPWVPIGYRSSGIILRNGVGEVLDTACLAIESPFCGNFDGNGKTIRIKADPINYMPLNNNLDFVDPETLGKIIPTNIDFGGIFGFVQGGSIKDLDVVIDSAGIKTQSTSTEREACFGGLVGHLQKGTIERCSVTGGPITAGSSYITVGGLVGINGSLENSRWHNLWYNEMDVGKISNCYTNISIIGSTKTNKVSEAGRENETSFTYTGGLVAYNRGAITNCYSTAGITLKYSDHNDYTRAGTLMGYVTAGPVQNSYWKDFGSSPSGYTGNGVTVTGGARSESRLREQSTFTGWDFDNTWKIHPTLNDGFPLLRPVSTTSLVLIANNSIAVFPNPAKEEIFIRSDSQVNGVEIYSLSGELMLSEPNFKGKISVSALPKGVYVVRVYAETGVVTEKIIKE